jgi:tRNA(fMet)-specific endonuclease VapC
MARYLLDTNHLSDMVKPVSPLRERVFQSHRAGNRFGVCVPVLCELEAGLERLKKRDRPRRLLNRLLTHIRLWPIGRTAARLYGEVDVELTRAGRVLSQVDMMIAALAREMNLTVLTTDRDFEALPDIKTENWLSPTAPSNTP